MAAVGIVETSIQSPTTQVFNGLLALAVKATVLLNDR